MKSIPASLLPSLALLVGVSCHSGSHPSSGKASADSIISVGADTVAVNAAFIAEQATKPPVIDGRADDSCWQQAQWYPMDQVWVGVPPSATDFSGRYKLAWDSNFVYVLAVINDDTLIDIHKNGLVKYWDDDCLEVFVDEDHSGGNHQYNYNAFAYHISLDGKVVDIGPDSLPHYYPQHCFVKRTQQGTTSTWEVAIRLFPDTYRDGVKNRPVVLKAGKTIGFAIAYNDNDHSPERENMIGNVFIPGQDKNKGWIDAGVFGSLLLKGK